jgi:Epoxide hydrolase N terminus
MSSEAGIRPFRVAMAEDAVADLRRRITATRWPDRETVADDSQGVRLGLMQELAACWGSGYDWRKCEARLKPQLAVRRSPVTGAGGAASRALRRPP